MVREFDLFRELTETSGAPGYEDRIRTVVRREFEGVVDVVRTDAMGNVVGTVEGRRDPEYEVAVAAHMDEIGFMVRHVTDDGFLQVDPLGGWDPRVLRAQRVTVHAADGDRPGVIGSPPPHTLDEEDLEAEDAVEDVYIDMGIDPAAVTDQVATGDLVTVDQRTERVGSTITGKAIDNRVSLYAMLQAAKMVDPAVTVHFAATVQEEVGLRGARALGVDLDPDLAIAVDTTVANDVPQVGDEADYVTELGEGAAIKLKDSSVITNPKVHRRLRRIAETEELPYQIEVLPSGGTDTGGFQQSAGAKPVGAISVPTRYLHTPTEVVVETDVTAVVDLLAAFLDAEDGENDYTL
ncbi:M42 family metallopeptidase [Halanaeroarchaeum sulfurireducens]|uniref:Peptidase M42 family protein n=1 Tax=Halanaeroarchaeum sulfurireducens TaxID=1604004 RepID=A0A0N7FTJ3_9EURY|nr:M20/M25/M40 family metallo-hydrolase [Halanaeroarchaeum sulfurireducens]ALG81719.1 peptidase M42 family protein [Halanaeroarchaeum sulfurireducens]